MAFARAFCDLFEKLKAHGPGQPSLPGAGTPSAVETLKMEWAKDEDDLWGVANIPELFTYLRGSTKLRIPDHFRPVIPRTMK